MSANPVVLQLLLHDSLLATGHVESCALFRKKDGTVKAASAGYEVRVHMKLCDFCAYEVTFSAVHF